MEQMQKDLQGGKVPGVPAINPSGNSGTQNFNTSNSAPSSGGICGGGAAAETVDCVCRSQFIEGRTDPNRIFKSLPKPNIQVLQPDFSIPVNQINTELNQPPRDNEKNPDVASLSIYKNAFESGMIASLFSQFLNTSGKKAEYMSILKQLADGDSGFDTKKKANKRDAQQAYGIMLLYYQSRGANVTRGLNYLKAAGKGDSKKAFIATYQLGHRAHFGIGESQNLSKAATWMLKSYEAVQERKNKELVAQTAIPLSQSFIKLVEDEFFNIVSNPNYSRREMYAELIQSARNMQAEMEQSMRDAKGRSPGVEAITRAYLRKESEINAKILRSIGEEDRAAIEEQRLQKFVDDQSKDTQKYSDYSYTSEKTRQFLTTALKSLEKLDDGQKQKFTDAMRELALLSIEMDRIGKHLVSKVVSGELSFVQINLALPVFQSVNVTCNLYSDLNTVATKTGAPKADVVFNSDAEDTVINMSMDD